MEGGRRGMKSRRRDMPAYLVPAETVEIGSKGLHVDLSMRRKCHSINAQQGAGYLVHDIGDSSHIRNSAQYVRSMRDSNEFCLVAHQTPQILGPQMRIRSGGLFVLCERRWVPPFDTQIAPGS